MTRLLWDSVGERFFETGVDRGVLYVTGTTTGVAWSGLTSVSESPSGGDPKPYYIDGVKYLNLSTAEEFEATITAFSAPTDFGRCDGIVPVQKGLYVTQQARATFGFSYRTLLGNDVSGTELGYKIHIVYNALAAPANRNNSSLSDSPEAVDLSWSITTLPPKLTGYRPTAHFVVDSRMTPTATLTAIEDILYGNATSSPRLPTVTELVALFNA
jgi:hypothetical protein